MWANIAKDASGENGNLLDFINFIDKEFVYTYT